MHSIFRPPQNQQTRDEWFKEIREHQEIGSRFMICQLHFEKEYLQLVGTAKITRLEPNAIPTIFKATSVVQTLVGECELCFKKY